MKKLDDLPKGKPNTYDDVMRALAVLHKGVLKQAALYGGKNSRLHIPQVVEGSLLRSIENCVDMQEPNLLIEESMIDLNFKIEKLSEHLFKTGDRSGLKLLIDAIDEITTLTSALAPGVEKLQK
jgi:hypothetical protein